LVRALPEDETRRGYGPHFEWGLTTCPEIMTALFEHFHSELSAPVKVAAIRVKGNRAIVLVYSSAMPLSVMEAKREGKAQSGYEARWCDVVFGPAA
jgi:hypothetical protein